MTLFPDIFNSYMNESIMKRAVVKGSIEVYIYNIRDFSNNKHKKVDDYPFGGGAGMLMTPQPIYDTYMHIVNTHDIKNPRVIYLTPKGKVHSQEIAQDMSIGDYVLTGGELPALILIDSISRLIPGVLSQNESFEEESFKDNLLEYPHYTRPREFMGMKVPDILLSGNHKKIEQWRYDESVKVTKERRPDLYKKTCKK